MKKNTILFIVFVASGVLIIFSTLLATRHPAKIDSQPEALADLPKIPSSSMFFEIDNFEQAISSAKTTKAQSNIQAIMVPQHLVASSLIAQQIKVASGREIETVFIIGPNHFNVGTSDIVSAQAIWETSSGEVVSDKKYVDKFLTDLKLLDGPEIFINEHAIGAVVPFVKYYLPQAKIVPIVFRSYADQSDVDQVVTWLADNLSKKSLVIYAIDFSHYLTREQADHMDKQTKQYIENNDINQIMNLGDDNLDSPASLASALALAHKKNWRLDIVANKNSDDFNLIKSSQTTSYFAINFYK
jgi:AmmeMemoRadiSam system protein B